MTTPTTALISNPIILRILVGLSVVSHFLPRRYHFESHIIRIHLRSLTPWKEAWSMFGELLDCPSLLWIFNAVWSFPSTIAVFNKFPSAVFKEFGFFFGEKLGSEGAGACIVHPVAHVVIAVCGATEGERVSWIRRISCWVESWYSTYSD
jgi:hypothetical protein